MFHADIRQVVTQTLGCTVRTWLDPIQAGGAERAARRGWVLMVSLGLLATANRPVIDGLELPPMWRRILRAVAVDSSPVTLPAVAVPAYMIHIPFNTGDPTTDEVLRATINALGDCGYEGAHLATIARAAGISEAAIFLRYPSKEALFVDAINRHQDIYMEVAYRDYYGPLE